MGRADMKALVMLPTYNERENIERMVESIFELEHSGVGELGIVIVDDNSPDGTGQLADKLAQKYQGKIYVIHRQERGRGTAGIAGFRYALTQDVEYIIEMDTDFSHNPKYIPQLLKETENYDIVIGSRFIKGGRSERSFLRKIISKGAVLYAWLLLRINIKDWHGGYKCYKKRVLAALDFDDFLSQGYAIGMETIYRLVRKGFSYKEIPIVFKSREQGSSKFSIREVFEYLHVVARLWRNRKAIQ